MLHHARRGRQLLPSLLLAGSLLVLTISLPRLAFVATQCASATGWPRFQESSRSVARHAGDSKPGTETKLMLAAVQDDVSKIQSLVKSGADVDAQDGYGWTALRYAVRQNHRDAAEALIELGANVNLASASGRTPLMSAAGNGLSGMIRLLLKAGADKEARSNDGRTAYEISLRGGSAGCTACREMLWFEGEPDKHTVTEIAF
eukprot:TRINITY_DN15999_c1_g1_i1.p1 TRINITY_DN15999_c1_g1~~TRINITY_DN15999_c1_g1_i1.p1  ORF type:complete len:203 (+),score=30.62 TRINITY_DN15999_c1_g1_i1:205-813(+)